MADYAQPRQRQLCLRFVKRRYDGGIFLGLLPIIAAAATGSVVQIKHGAMLIAFVQGIVGAFDKHFGPLQDGRGQESCDRAKDHLLKKRGGHRLIGSMEGATWSLVL